ncbi:(d)CMP kinase [Conexibacter sp. DBS9H8]|uniref:(d)CMP kinase n=1 Tax=Conexibacter sp. DBS9H8 TaxID=2937801 RepID=UPI00200F4003|nr:(d)CMP kinase [Conexibacter sp. DBS9H8]
MVIALDGPAGAGKSTVARAVADALGFTYLDTGAMYRCVALAALTRGEAPDRVATSVRIELTDAVRLDGVDVSAAIRDPEVSAEASRIAVLPAVRAALVTRQRELIAAGGDWVAEGRDIGTVVWPEAELKVFLTASPEARARRRSAQTGAPYEQTLAEQIERDARDGSRAQSPLRAAADAICLDSTGLRLSEVVAAIARLARERMANRPALS